MSLEEQELIQQAHVMNIEISSRQSSLLLRYADLLIEANKKLNLTAIIDEEDVLTKHILDSLSLWPVIQQLPILKGAFIDVGTGGGCPGIPLGIVSGMQGTLIDSVSKKAKAVEAMVKELALDKQLTVQAIRAEELAQKQGNGYSLMVARAVAPLNVLLEYASPLLSLGAYAVLQKGVPSEQEELEGAYAAALCGMKFVSRETYSLGFNTDQRSLYVYKKCEEPHIPLPRRVGMARKRPLQPKD